MSITSAFFGSGNLEIGAANMYVKPLFEADGVTQSDWQDISDWIFLGLTESTTFRVITSKADLVASQKGARPADKAISSQQVQIETNLGQSYLERLENIIQGFSIDRNSAGDVVQWKISKKLGRRDSENLMWLKIIKFGQTGVESASPLDTAYALVAPASETIELLFDAESQRFFGVTFESYENDAISTNYPVSDSTGSPCYCWSEEII